jgi:glycosyltransferase involved in cell wall biosynthesis
MRILMAIHGLPMGGAEKFFTNLACALHERHEVTCCIPALRCGDAAMRRRLGDVRVEEVCWFTPLSYRIFYKVTLMLQRRFPRFDPGMALHTRNLRRLHARHRFDIVNAHLMPAARQVCTAFQHDNLPIVKSDHGDTVPGDPADDVIFRRLDALICPAEANAQRAKSLPLRPDCRVSTIPYGYCASPTSTSALPPFDGITFGMVARGVEEKGWREALAAARVVRTRSARPIRLVFVGGGPCLDGLAGSLTAQERSWILFAGKQDEPERFVQGFDVGLLPTFLPGESLPNSIIECLAAGKPVIATNVGGIPEMLRHSGVLIPLGGDGRADVGALADAMLRLTDDEPRHARAAGTHSDFARHDMNRCVASYEELFLALTA